MYPNNIELEKSVLGCLLLGKLDHIIKLQEADFLNEANKLIYKTILYLFDKKVEIDIISVSDAIKKRLENSLDLAKSTLSRQFVR